jgi:transposase
LGYCACRWGDTDGWPIVHHVWEGNRLDHSTVQEIIGELRTRFEFSRVVFVGDRGMVTEENLQHLTEEGQGYLVGVKRRGNARMPKWLDGG